MFDQLERAGDELEAVVAGLEPEVLDGATAARLVEKFARLARLCSAGETLAARAVARSGGWRSGGDRSAAHWLARATGTSVGKAVAMLETAERLAELPATDEVFRAGRLSEAQVSEIASAAAACPAAESTLLRAAETDGVGGLRETCRKVRAAALPDENARYDAVRRSRYLRHWAESDGAFRLDARLTPDAGATVLAALQPHKEQAFRSAREAGRREPYEAYAADALVALAASAGSGVSPSSPRAMVHVRVDHAAFRRGHALEGETCEIAGVGPIPVASARAWTDDAILTAILTDGVDVTAVAHLGRTIPAHLRSALVARDPVCVVPGCNVRDFLEIDHVKPFAEGGPTSLGNLGRLCPWHHYLKTHHGYRLERVGTEWRWLPPERPDPPGPSSESGSEGELTRAAVVERALLALAAPP